MKPTSKKDEFIIKINSGKQVQSVKDYYCPDNSDSWVHFNFAILHDELGKYRMLFDSIPIEYSKLSVISFEEWQNLPNEPNDVYSNSEFNSERFETKCGHVYTEDKRIIGFNIIDDKYTEPIAKICEIDDIGDFKPNKQFPYSFSFNCDVATTLKDLNVLYIWCEPVFKDESITLKSGKALTASEIEEVKEILKNK